MGTEIFLNPSGMEHAATGNELDVVLRRPEVLPLALAIPRASENPQAIVMLSKP